MDVQLLKRNDMFLVIQIFSCSIFDPQTVTGRHMSHSTPHSFAVFLSRSFSLLKLVIAICHNDADCCGERTNREAYTEVKKPDKPPTAADDTIGNAEPEVSIPAELQCVLCHGLLRDAVYLSCCVASCCDDCIRTALIESDDHQCPVCQVIGVSPDTLIPCIKLRKEVTKFVNLSNPLWPKEAAPQLPDPAHSPEQQQSLSQTTTTDQSNGSPKSSDNKLTPDQVSSPHSDHPTDQP